MTPQRGTTGDMKGLESAGCSRRRDSRVELLWNYAYPISIVLDLFLDKPRKDDSLELTKGGPLKTERNKEKKEPPKPPCLKRSYPCAFFCPSAVFSAKRPQFGAPGRCKQGAVKRWTQMKYTVIIPVYNGEETIGECISSLIEQKGAVYGEDYSILVVDDGSTDRTGEIAKTFPVKIVQMPKNQGRIMARLVGARKAETERLLFVDSRVTLPGDTIAKLSEFDGLPAVIGETDPAGTKHESLIHTVLYLIRRRYYGKEFFPVTEDMVISEQNFRRAPKGTAVLLIDSDLFLKLTPERTGKNVNDDTLLFHNLVYDKKISLLRSRKLFFRYSQRTNPRQFSSWLFHRGVRFSDFYLRPGGYFHVHFLLLAAAMAALLSLILVPQGPLFLAALAIGIDAAISVYLSEERGDFIRVFFGMPAIVMIFGSGVAAFWTKKLLGALKRRNR